MSPISVFSSVYNKSNLVRFDIIEICEEPKNGLQPENRRMDQRGRGPTGIGADAHAPDRQSPARADRAQRRIAGGEHRPAERNAHRGIPGPRFPSQR